MLLRALTGEHLVIIGTCRLNGIDPEAYLRHILSVLSEWPGNKVVELMPWNVDLTRQ